MRINITNAIFFAFLCAAATLSTEPCNAGSVTNIKRSSSLYVYADVGNNSETIVDDNDFFSFNELGNDTLHAADISASAAFGSQGSSSTASLLTSSKFAADEICLDIEASVTGNSDDGPYPRTGFSSRSSHYIEFTLNSNATLTVSALASLEFDGGLHGSNTTVWSMTDSANLLNLSATSQSFTPNSIDASDIVLLLTPGDYLIGSNVSISDDFRNSTSVVSTNASFVLITVPSPTAAFAGLVGLGAMALRRRRG